MPVNSIKILLVANNPSELVLIQDALKKVQHYQFTVIAVDCLTAAIAQIKNDMPEAILLDLELPDSGGIETYRAINQIAMDIPIIILSVLNDEPISLETLQEGAQDYIVKDNINADVLLKTILYAIKRKQAERGMREYSAIVENAEEAILSHALDGTVISWNRSAAQIYGYQAEEIIGQNILLLVPAALKGEIAKISSLISKGEKLVNYETYRLHKEGRKINVLLTISPIKDPLGNFSRASIISRDITDRKLKEQELALQYRIAVTLAESPTLEHATFSVLKNVGEILEWQVGEIWAVDQNHHLLQCVSTWVSDEKFKKMTQNSYQTTLAIEEGIPGYIWFSKRSYWASDLTTDTKCTSRQLAIAMELRCCIGCPIFFKDDFMGVMVFFGAFPRQFDVGLLTLLNTVGEQIGGFIKRKRVEGDLLFLAQHDVLTRLANRNVFENFLIEALSKATIQNRMVAVIYLDLDGFKEVNDSAGHAAGDGILREVAERLRQSVRVTDVVSRFGGDEFVIILPALKNIEDVNPIGEKILTKIAQPFNINGLELYVTASMGISLFPGDGENYQTLIKNADLALYQAKENGGNQLRFCNPGLTGQILRKTTLEKNMVSALSKHELFLNYQPIVNAQTGKTVSVEALVRWRSKGKILRPAEFIPIAEESHLIIPVGEWILRTACEQNYQFNSDAKIIMAVNISALQLADQNFLDLVEKILLEGKINPTQLELEITESTLMKEVDKNKSLLKQLKALGIKISIDDFGTGYSSFGYLRDFMVDNLKVDMSFIADLPHDARVKEMVVAIIAMAHSLGIQVIAEGVEKKEQADFLMVNGCDKLQGNYFSKPVLAAEIQSLLNNQNPLL